MVPRLFLLAQYRQPLVLVALMPALLCLFAFLSRVDVLQRSEVERCVSLFLRAKTLRLTSQISVHFQTPEPIDDAIPKEAHIRTGFDGNEYERVFSACEFLSVLSLPQSSTGRAVVFPALAILVAIRRLRLCHRSLWPFHFSHRGTYVHLSWPQFPVES